VIETDFYSILSTAPGVTAICDSRIYPVRLPTEAIMPAIHYAFVGGSSKPTFDTPGIQKYRVEVNCWGTQYLDAIALRHAVIAALNRFSANGVLIQFIQSVDFDDHETLQSRALAEFYVWANFTP
jgi:hypothetical protein